MSGVEAQTAGHFEPFCEVTFLPRCSACHAPHPQAMNPPRISNKCPACDAPIALGRQKTTVPAKLTGADPLLALGLFFQACGRWLRNLANKV